jgi:hypothetical protein
MNAAMNSCATEATMALPYAFSMPTLDLPSRALPDPNLKAEPLTNGNVPDSTGRHFPSRQWSQSAFRQ